MYQLTGKRRLLIKGFSNQRFLRSEIRLPNSAVSVTSMCSQAWNQLPLFSLTKKKGIHWLSIKVVVNRLLLISRNRIRKIIILWFNIRIKRISSISKSSIKLTLVMRSLKGINSNIAREWRRQSHFLLVHRWSQGNRNHHYRLFDQREIIVITTTITRRTWFDQRRTSMTIEITWQVRNPMLRNQSTLIMKASTIL